MASSSEKLPKFERPPVVEVALSAQFQALPNLGVAQLGLVWNRFRKRFPRVEQHPTIPHVIERKGLRPSTSPIQFEILSGRSLAPRVWMLNQNGTELVQVQSDRFVRNWRKQPGTEGKYPQYEAHLRPQFRIDYSEFEQFAADEHLGNIVIDQCEVTYINHIYGDGIWEHHGQIDRVFKGWTKDYSTTVEFPTETVGVRAGHVLSDEAGDFVGRLHIQIDSGLDTASDSANVSPPLFNLQLVARGRPIGEGLTGVLGFLDLGHRAIVTTFAKITTPAMHGVWKRYQ